MSLEPQLVRRDEEWQAAATREALTLESPFPFTVVPFDPEFFGVMDDPDDES